MEPMRIQRDLTPSRQGNIGWLALGVAVGMILIIVGIFKAIF